MIIDTSAVMAVFKHESRAHEVIEVVAEADVVRISAPTLVELTAVLSGQNDVSAHHRADSTLAKWNVETVPFDAEQAALAQAAYRTYGRGAGHPAKLNLGDCYSYALAKAKGEPLLFVGDDFAHTDIRSAL